MESIDAGYLEATWRYTGLSEILASPLHQRKKAKLGETPTKSTPQKSLAEYRAVAFNEAAGEDTVNNESNT